MLFATHKKKIAVFPGNAAYEARVLVSVMEGETALVRVPDSDSTSISIHRTFQWSHLFYWRLTLCVCVCVRRKKGRFSVILAVMGYQNTCVFVLAAQITWWDWRLFFWVHQKCQMHFYMLVTFWNAIKCLSHGSIISLSEIKHIWHCIKLSHIHMLSYSKV